VQGVYGKSSNSSSEDSSTGERQPIMLLSVNATDNAEWEDVAARVKALSEIKISH
jgi:hypothetical protein